MALIASVSDSLNIWSFEGKSAINLKSTYRNVNEKLYCMSWNHTNQVIAVGGTEPKISLIQAGNGQLLSSLQLSETRTPGLQIKCVAFSNNSRYLATSMSPVVQLWDLKKRQLKCVFNGHTQAVTSVCFLSDGHIVAGDVSGSIQIWNPKGSTEKAAAELLVKSTGSDLYEQEGQDVSCLQVSTLNSAVLGSGYGNGSLCIWDVSSSWMLRKQQSHSGRLTALAFSPKNVKLVSTAGIDGRVTLVDINSPNLVECSATIDIGERVNALSFNEDAIHTAVGTQSGRILLYDWRNSKRPVHVIEPLGPSPVHALSFQTGRAPELPVASSTSSVASTTTTITAAAAASQQSHVTANDGSVAAASSVPPSPPRVASATQTPVKSTAATVQSGSSANGSTGGTSQRESSRGRTPIKPSGSYAAIPAANPPYSATKATATVPLPVTQVYGAGSTSVASSLDSKFSVTETQKPVSAYSKSLSTTLPAKTAPVAAAPAGSKSAGVASSSSMVAGAGQGSIAYGHSESKQQQTTPHASVAGNQAAATPATVQSIGTPLRNKSSASATGTAASTGGDDYSDIRNSVRPVTMTDLEESLQLLRYDIHTEMQDIIREQNRQFLIAKEDQAKLISDLVRQVQELFTANKELREENAQLRKIY